MGAEHTYNAKVKKKVDLSVENEKLRKKLKAAVALKDWATHTPTCNSRRTWDPNFRCDCGLNEGELYT